MGGNREFKLRHYAENPFCYYCGRKMVLTSIPEISGKPDPLMCTVEHLVSRFNISRWVKTKPGERRRVLACWECNQKRAKEEADRLPRELITKMSTGFTLNPRGDKSIFNNTVDSVDEARKRLEEHGVEYLLFPVDNR